MSRLLLTGISCGRISATRPPSQLQLRMASKKQCPPAYPPNTCGPKVIPHITPVCTTHPSESGRKDEEFDKCIAANIANPTPACTPPQFEAFPCEKQPWPKNRGVVVPFIGKSAWETVEGCNQIKCAYVPFRHDVEYLKPEEKCLRRTWYEFGAVCEVEEDKCVSPKLDVVAPEQRPRVIKKVVIPKVRFDICEPEKRPTGQVNKAATSNQPPIKIDSCPKIRLPGCKKPHEKLKCVPPVAPKCCAKRCTQYPSYSECCRAKPDDLSPSECKCTSFQNQCSAFERAKWLLLN